MSEHNEKTNISFRSKKQKNKTNYCTNQKKKYCHVCCKYFSTKSSYIHHMSTYHNETDTFKIPCTSKLVLKSKYKTTNKKYWIDPTDIFMKYFENEMSLDFKKGNDKFRCFSCHHNFANRTEYLKHEIIHYRESNINNNVHVNQEIYNSEIRCILCQHTFTSMSDFDEHKNKDCKYDIHHKNSIKCENNFKRENEKLEYKSEVKLELVPQKFNCLICKQMCECLNHWEIHKWWSKFKAQVEFRIFECYVCNEQFTEEREFKTHEIDHVRKNIC